MSFGINLHNVVRGAITAIHPDENCILYQSLGQKNVKGVVKAVYAEPKQIKANFQPDPEALEHTDAKSVTSCSEKVYLYSDTPAVMGQKRLPTTRTGDIIGRNDGTFWLIVKLSEDWSWDGWACVDVSLLVTPPDFSASEWSDSYAGSGQ